MELALTQETLALEAGVNRTFVAKLELGQTSPSLSTLYKLSAALKVEPEELVGSLSKRHRKEQRIARKRPSAE